MPARTKRDALCYLRRSTSKQEMGIHGQLEWALQTARKHEVNLEASPDDIDEMLERGLKSYRGILLDDGVSGGRLDRPGFVALRREAIQKRNVSHILIHKSDRFARPEQAIQAMSMETELLLAGLTIVFSNRTSEPRERGIHYFDRDILLLHEYSLNGEFLTQLAERVLAAQIRLAKGGFWTGGPAPYGFVRVLCDTTGNEVMVLDEKTTVRREGCHVRIRVDERKPERIETWLKILKWYDVDGWGVKRIANRLNELRIPSPSAGQSRVIDGVLRPNSGKWRQNSVMSLIKNQAIIGMAVFGTRSEGAHRRFSPDGPRTLTESDRTEGDRTRSIPNPKEEQIIVETGYKPAASIDLFQSCQEQCEKRGRSQRGISKSDPAVYPLSTRIYDITGNCNATFYGVKKNEKRSYICSAYTESNGRECFRHSINADVALRYTVNTLRQRLIAAGGRKALRSRLEALAADDHADSSDAAQDELALIEKRCASLKAEAETTLTNMSRAKSDAACSALEKRYEATLADIEKLDSEAEVLRRRKTVGTDGRHRAVEDALALYDEIDRITTDENARPDINRVLKQLNFQMGLHFIENPRCKRPKRILAGGRLTLGDNPRRGDNSHGSGDHPSNTDGDEKDLESDSSGCSHSTPAAHVVQQADQSIGKDQGGKRRCSGICESLET